MLNLKRYKRCGVMSTIRQMSREKDNTGLVILLDINNLDSERPHLEEMTRKKKRKWII